VLQTIHPKAISMKQFLVTAAIALLAAACGGSDKPKENNTPAVAESKPDPQADAKKGIGKFTQVAIGATLDKAKADSGQKVYDLKCMSCHRLTADKLVGPGWKDVTTRRTPEWVMNFVTNVDEMLEKDAVAQAQLEVCLVRMPNQNLTDADARNVFEFMRRNDGVQ
jgi:cytochrome c2